MPLFQSFNYNNDRHQHLFLSTSLLSTSPFILLFILLLMNFSCRGRMFSFIEGEGVEQEKSKIILENEQIDTLNVEKENKRVEEVKTDSVKKEEGLHQKQDEPHIEQSHPTIQQKEEINESSPPINQSPIESTSALPEPSSSPPTTTSTLTTTPLQEEKHPHSKRNYASKECGAKVLYSNEEAENKGAILNDPERDDYMRNPCERAQNKFLIIELCETIQLNSFEIANFELFSSNPKDFRLWGSERYPTQEWILIGDFEAQNIRQLQSFDVKQNTLYVKFVKLELLTHYGNEHFCTLSTFVIYGTSIVDEYEAEAASTTLQQQQQFTQMGDGLKEEINKNVTINETIKECSNVEEVLEENAEKIITKNDLKNDENNLTKNINNQTNEEEENKEQKSTETGNMLKTIVEQLGSNIKNVIGQAFSKNNGNEENAKNDEINLKKNYLRYTFSTCQQCSSKHSPTTHYLSLFCWAFFPNVYRIIKHKQQYLFDSTKKFIGANKFQNYFLDKVLRRQTSSFCPLPSLPLTCNRKSEINNVGEEKQQTKNLNKNNSEQQTNEQQKQQINSDVVENVENVVKTQQIQKPVTPTHVLDEKVVRPLPGTSTNSKESIFMKLNKRLVLLEQNMSTSNEHLNELTKRVGTQSEEFSAKQEKIAKTTAENVAKH
ncbi:hypothetical protein ACQ4LE_004360, partial [Meloidogyne hapla]